MGEKENLPLAIHNNRLYIIYKTELSWDEFANFTSALEPSLLSQTSVPKGKLRHMIALYLSDKLRYTTQSTYELEMFRDHNRHYYGHKTAKDLLVLIQGDSLSIQ